MVDISSDHWSATSTLLENAHTSIAHLEVVTGCDCSDCHQESILISQFVWTTSCITLQNLASKDLTWDSWTWTKSCTLAQWGTFDSSSERLRACWQELVEGQKKCPGENVGRNDVTIFNNQCLLNGQHLALSTWQHRSLHTTWTQSLPIPDSTRSRSLSFRSSRMFYRANPLGIANRHLRTEKIPDLLWIHGWNQILHAPSTTSCSPRRKIT